MAASAAQQAAIAIAKKRKGAAGKKPQKKGCGKKFPGDYDRSGRVTGADFKKYHRDCKKKK